MQTELKNSYNTGVKKLVEELYLLREINFSSVLLLCL